MNTGCLSSTLTFLVVVSIVCTNAQQSDKCQPFVKFDGTSVQAKNCTSFTPFCCGGCQDRFCCSNLAFRLDQTKCTPSSNLTTETCRGYITSTNKYMKGFKCKQDYPYCCGSCLSRSCCRHLAQALNQSTCPNNYSDLSSWDVLIYPLILIIPCCLSVIIMSIASHFKRNGHRREYQRGGDQRVVFTVDQQNNNGGGITYEFLSKQYEDKPPAYDSLKY